MPSPEKVVVLLVVALPACGARSGLSDLGPDSGLPTVAGTADAWVEASVPDDGPLVPDAEDAGQFISDASCDQASPGGVFTCCNGQPCRGGCWNQQDCLCGDIGGGCWGDAICCGGPEYGTACTLPSAPICNLLLGDAEAPPDDGGLPVLDGSEPYPIVDAGGTCAPRGIGGPATCCGGVPCVGYCVELPSGQLGCDCYGIVGGCRPDGAGGSNGPMCCPLLYGCATAGACYAGQ